MSDTRGAIGGKDDFDAEATLLFGDTMDAFHRSPLAFADLDSLDTGKQTLLEAPTVTPTVPHATAREASVGGFFGRRARRRDAPRALRARAPRRDAEELRCNTRGIRVLDARFARR